MKNTDTVITKDIAGEVLQLFIKYVPNKEFEDKALAMRLQTYKAGIENSKTTQKEKFEIIAKALNRIGIDNIQNEIMSFSKAVSQSWIKQFNALDLIEMFISVKKN